MVGPRPADRAGIVYEVHDLALVGPDIGRTYCWAAVADPRPAHTGLDMGRVVNNWAANTVVMADTVTFLVARLACNRAYVVVAPDNYPGLPYYY